MLDVPRRTSPSTREVGAVDHERVTRVEFSALLQLLVPADGSQPNIRKTEARVKLSEVVGGAHVFRMQTFQRQRAQRLVVRMVNFGYPDAIIKTFVQTLFLSKLHNKDLWRMWEVFTKGRTEEPLEFKEIRRLLALFNESADTGQLEALIRQSIA